MGMIITVDCGTTNMRCRLYRENEVLCEARRKVGTRNTAFDGHNGKLKEGLRECVEEILQTGIYNADFFVDGELIGSFPFEIKK